MKRFFAVFDGYHTSVSTFQYAIELSRIAGAHLVGLFPDEATYRTYNVYKVLSAGGQTDKLMEKLDKQDKKKRDNAISLFQSRCEHAGIPYSVHRDRGIAIQEIKHESVYADLMIIDKTESFSIYPKKNLPSDFVKDLLGDAQCPVLVVPHSYCKPSKILFLYDGKPSSVYAAKMFTYLFSNPANKLAAEVISVKEKKQDHHIPDNKNIREFMKANYPGATFRITSGDPEMQIPAFLKNKEASCAITVLGAYRRSELSRWYKTSMADILMKNSESPLFIAHNK